MKFVISGTNRPGSRSSEVSKWIQREYKRQGEEIGLIELTDVGLDQIQAPYTEDRPAHLVEAVERTKSADGLIIVCPEYNGSYPGALKYFIDHWAYPDSFEYRPVCFVGLGGRWGGLRPVEHLQGVFGYRNSFMYPERVFISDVWNVLKDGEIHEDLIVDLLKQQVTGFRKFVDALNSAGLSANSRSHK